MQNTTLDFLQQLTPTQSIAMIAAVLALGCVAWMSIRLLGTLARLALIAGAAALLVSATGLVPGLETQNQETLEAFGDSVKPIFADATVFIESLTTLTFVADEEDTSGQLSEDALIQTILSQNDGPSGHTEQP